MPSPFFVDGFGLASQIYSSCGNFDRYGISGMPAAKQAAMNSPTDFSTRSESHTAIPNFWERVLNDATLRDCDNLEKLLAGCEIIAAVDHVDLLAA